YRHGDVSERGATGEGDSDAAQFDEGCRALAHDVLAAPRRQREQKPRTSTVCCSTAKPSLSARRSTAAVIADSSSSAVMPHPAQMRNWLACGSSGRAQPI